MWGARGSFLPGAAMVVTVVMPAVNCNKATEKINKILILVVCNQCLYVLLYCKTYYDSHIANCSLDQARVVWWPEPEPLWSNGPRHIGYCRKALVIVRMILTLY